MQFKIDHRKPHQRPHDVIVTFLLLLIANESHFSRQSLSGRLWVHDFCESLICPLDKNELARPCEPGKRKIQACIFPTDLKTSQAQRLSLLMLIFKNSRNHAVSCNPFNIGRKIILSTAEIKLNHKQSIRSFR